MAMQQGGMGAILTMLIVSAPPMAAVFFQGMMGNFNPYSAFAQQPGPVGAPGQPGYPAYAPPPQVGQVRSQPEIHSTRIPTINAPNEKSSGRHGQANGNR
jgi:type IV secretion system protein VirB6